MAKSDIELAKLQARLEIAFDKMPSGNDVEITEEDWLAFFDAVYEAKRSIPWSQEAGVWYSHFRKEVNGKMSNKGLRPLFKWYGSKWSSSKHYPAPLPGLPVFEPFAGSAGYALRHHRHDVVLWD